MSTKITYETGEVYEGHWNSEGRRHGTGKLTLPDSTVYCGKFHEGFFSGLGVLTLPDKSRYEGNFEKGLYNGLGVFTNSEGMKYEGEFKNGNPEGKGLVTFADGTHGLPRNEGRFTGGKCVERCKVAGQVLQAQKDAAMARSIAEQAGN